MLNIDGHKTPHAGQLDTSVEAEASKPVVIRE